LTDNDFPLKVLGGVHLRNHIVQHEPLFLTQKYRADLKMDVARRRPQGLEIDFRTQVKKSDSGSLVWESLTTFLFRKKFKDQDSESALSGILSNLSDGKALSSFSVPANTGKRFGMLTKDINPIHMSKMLARLFGFKRDICHGMWAVGRSLGAIQNVDYDKPVRNDVSFKGPMHMEDDITIKVSAADPFRFELYSGKNERPCVVGCNRNVSSGENLA
ncbi:MAG: hypothetical protein HQK54_17135, partial [Oligoflexales bacterium]|nr:hypothetical protein [Oligoflexales bacterium]